MMSLFCAWIIIAAGMVLRFWHYFENRSLWGEEAKYAISILSRSYREIFYYIQIVPDQPLNALGFYLVEKSAADLFGPTEYALRLYPLVCSVLSLFFFFQLARIYLKPKAVLVALALFAFSDALIYFAAEVKPFSSDVLMSLILILYFERAKTLNFNPKSMLTLSILGAVVIWFSNVSLFMLATVGICLADQIISFKHYKRIPSFIGVISVWLVSFLVLYLVAFSHLIQSQYAWSAVKGKFCDAPFWSTATLDWVIQVSQSMFENPAGFQFSLVASIIFLTGIQAIARKDMDRLILAIIPFLIVFVMGCFRLYPVFGREILFLCPLIYIVIAAGLFWVVERFGKIGFIVSLATGVLLMHLPLTSAVDKFYSGREIQQNRQVFDYLKIHYNKGDTICLNSGAIYPFGYYMERDVLSPGGNGIPVWEISDFIISSNHGRWLALNRDILKYNAGGLFRERRIISSFAMIEASMLNIFKQDRVWLVFSDPQWPADKLTLDYFNRIGERRQGSVMTDAAIFLFDMKNPNRFKNRKVGPIVFIGDSLFALNDWVSFMNNENILNLGVVGERITGVYYRLDQVLPLNPEKIFLMVGINDKPSPETLNGMLSSYEGVLKKIRTLTPDSEIYVHSLLPVHTKKLKRNFSREIKNESIQLFNRRLKLLCDRYQATYIDLYSNYLRDGQLNPAWTKDGVHLNREGYRHWKPFLERYIPAGQKVN